MEQRMITPQERIDKTQTIIKAKIELIADYIQKGMNEFAMIELGALNEYVNLQFETAIREIPNTNY